ncbi:unnamed protein product [Kuraishia capsulata CBS 1993]|uniref:COX assembly mitochondrial protein n=1 Tax=Kuraishia capsulata CBS 1993 TaxID=1382522 RepID=W6MID8_9ASCO|nr:uncharacterized protein KUCA_T00001882001 [Kuraishia capsulata CBS 1993]CDK25911.1 unnamed protein product [Kuraishia capsulata CBS 1993]
MHPVLDKDRFMACEDLIEALEECHRLNFMKKAFGACNIQKSQLSNCLHETRLAADREKILVRREKNKKFEEKMKKIKEEEWGKDMKLKKVVEKELERLAAQGKQ